MKLTRTYPLFFFLLACGAPAPAPVVSEPSAPAAAEADAEEPAVVALEDRERSGLNQACGNRGQAACAEGLICNRNLAPGENISGRCTAPTRDTP